MFKKLDKLLVTSFIPPFIVAFCIAVFVHPRAAHYVHPNRIKLYSGALFSECGGTAAYFNEHDETQRGN